MNGLRRVGIVLALALGQLVAPVSDAPLTHASTLAPLRSAESVQQRSAPPCSDPMGRGRWAQANPRLEFEEGDVGPPGAWGRPRLCVVFFPEEDVYNFTLSGIEHVEQFRAAKAEALNRLRARGVDLCKGSKWASWGSPNQQGYTADDYYSMDMPCEPQLRAVDPGASAFLPAVQDALARAADATAQDLGQRAEHPVSVLVVTQPVTAVRLFKQTRASFESDDAVEAAAVNGVSRWVQGQGTNYIYGTVILINLTDQNYATPAKIDLDVFNTFSAHAFKSVVGTDPSINTGTNNVAPRWFESGVYTRQAYRHAVGGGNGGYLVEAARAARDGVVPPISALQSFDQEKAAFAQYGYYVVTARTYATVLYLFETYGADGMAGLLRENRNGSVGKFNDLLGRLTGTDAAGLDRAVTSWLLGLPSHRAASADGRVQAELLLYGLGGQGEILIEEAEAGCLFDLTSANVPVPAAPGLVGLSVTVGGDGAYVVSRPSARAGNAVFLAGVFGGPGQFGGVYRVTNDALGCTSGEIALIPA